MDMILINPPYTDDGKIELFIREHYKDFLYGVDSDYIKDINIDGYTYFAICNRMGKYCYKIRSKKDGKHTTKYYLKPEAFQGIRETKPNEPIKYVNKIQKMKFKK